MNEIVKKNQEKFSSLRELNLPAAHYAITGSGLLGVKNLRAINDIDIIVTEELWEQVSNEHGTTIIDGIERVVFPGGVVEAFRDTSFFKNDPPPPITHRIAHAEMIDGLPFERAENIIHYKKLMGREKDLADVQLLEGMKRQVTRIGAYGIVRKGEKILLVTQEKGPYAGKYDLPGGGLEFGESPEVALRREFLEEVGMEFQSMKLFDNFTVRLEVPMTPPFTFYQIGMIYEVSGLKEVHSSEIMKYEWVGVRDLKEEKVSPFLWKIIQ